MKICILKKTPPHNLHLPVKKNGRFFSKEKVSYNETSRFLAQISPVLHTSFPSAL
jgi:hypothetical protein